VTLTPQEQKRLLELLERIAAETVRIRAATGDTASTYLVEQHVAAARKLVE